MLKLKFQLDPENKTQMSALAAFASTLSGQFVALNTAAESTTAAEAPADDAPEEIKQKTEAPAEEKVDPPKRKRRSTAEIRAEKEAAAEQEAEEEAEEESDGGEDAEEEGDGGEDAEEQDAEEQGAKGGVSTAERKGKKITLDDIRGAVAEKRGNPANVVKMKETLLSKFGVKTTPELDVDHYAAFFDFVNGLKD